LTLRIAIDARAAAEVPAGRGRFVRELLAALRDHGADHRYELLCREPGPVEGGLDERFTWVALREGDPLWHLHAARRADRTADVLLSTNSYLTAWFTSVPTAIVVHDMVPFVAPDLAQRRAAVIERATIRPALRRTAALACVSAWTERDLVELFPAASGKTAVLPHAAHPRFRPDHPAAAIAAACARHDLPERFVLGVGTLEPRKNLTRLIDAYTALPEQVRASTPLALVGPKGWEADEIERRAGEAGVRITGFVSDEDLALLYSGCTAFAYPSLYEGFGLPVLEALAAGAPTVTATNSSLPEVAGDAALLVDAHDTRAIADALQRLLTDDALAARLRAAGPERAAAFSWARTAAGYSALLERVAAGS
jgi:glycosyltransferase involved in cell wall biosynthesis